jgi:hypothetical protein
VPEGDIERPGDEDAESIPSSFLCFEFGFDDILLMDKINFSSVLFLNIIIEMNSLLEFQRNFNSNLN